MSDGEGGIGDAIVGILVVVGLLCWGAYALHNWGYKSGEAKASAIALRAVKKRDAVLHKHLATERAATKALEAELRKASSHTRNGMERFSLEQELSSLESRARLSTSRYQAQGYPSFKLWADQSLPIQRMADLAAASAFSTASNVQETKVVLGERGFHVQVLVRPSRDRRRAHSDAFQVALCVPRLYKHLDPGWIESLRIGPSAEALVEIPARRVNDQRWLVSAIQAAGDTSSPLPAVSYRVDKRLGSRRAGLWIKNSLRVSVTVQYTQRGRPNRFTVPAGAEKAVQAVVGSTEVELTAGKAVYRGPLTFRGGHLTYLELK